MTTIADLKPVSRLDFTTEGLCLITSNGKLSRIMESSTMERSYRLRAHGLINESKLSGLRRGLTVDGIKYKPMAVKIERTIGTNSWMTVDTEENKAGALKKVFAALYLKPTRVICTGFGPYRLSTLLPEGVDWAEVKLTPELIKLFRQ
jgi:23S rRNA pseudouridine2605 synthase